MTPAERVPLGTVAKQWTRLGVIGFGGPPTHIVLLRRLCVEQRGWLDGGEFEDALATVNMLPGPALIPSWVAIWLALPCSLNC